MRSERSLLPVAAALRWQRAGGIAWPRKTERSAHTGQEQHREHGPNVCQPKGWGLLWSWLQRRQRRPVPGCVTLGGGNQKAHQDGGLPAGLRGGTRCGCILVSGFTPHGLLFPYSCKALPDCLSSISVILEGMRCVLGIWGEREPAR